MLKYFIVSVQCVRVKSDPDYDNNNNEEAFSDRNTISTKEVTNSPTARTQENTDEENLVLPSVKNLATLFQDVKMLTTQNNTNICLTGKKSSEAGSVVLAAISPIMSKGEMDIFQVNLSPAMLTVKGQNNDSYLSQVRHRNSFEIATDAVMICDFVYCFPFKIFYYRALST